MSRNPFTRIHGVTRTLFAAALIAMPAANRASAGDSPIKPRVLWTDAPVIMTERALGNWRREKRIWEENIYPIGNGRLGATVFGEPQMERLQFNENSLWVGNEDNRQPMFTATAGPPSRRSRSTRTSATPPGSMRCSSNLTNLKLTRTDAQVNSDWGTNSPNALLGADTFSVRWSGLLLVPQTGFYTFSTCNSDGVRLNIMIHRSSSSSPALYRERQLTNSREEDLNRVQSHETA